MIKDKLKMHFTENVLKKILFRVSTGPGSREKDTQLVGRQVEL